MKISKPIKVLIGAITAVVALFPFVIGPAMMILFVFVAPGFPFFDYRGGTNPEDMARIMPMFFLFFFLTIMCFSVFQLALQVFYLALVIKNKQLTDVSRVLFALAVFFMPFVAMPLYFVAYFWSDRPQETGASPASTPVA